MENGRSIYDEMSRKVWKEVENRKVDEARMAKVERERGEFKRPTIDEKIAIARIVKEKKEERNNEEDLIELRMLQLMPPGCNIGKGKGYDDMIGCAIVVSVSTSYSRYYDLALSSQSPYVILTICLMYCTLLHHVLLVYIA